jgi:hypothetical protein
MGPEIQRNWMLYQGYTDDEVSRILAEPDHSLCERGRFGWDCEDGDGNYRHQEHLEAEKEAQLIMFVLEHQSNADWTQDSDGIANNSPPFLSLCKRLIRDDAHNLLAGSTARLVLAQLAHVHGYAPTSHLPTYPIDNTPTSP